MADKPTGMRGDLHMHTTKSDGVWRPQRLFDEIRARDLRIFSVTDHDCIDAYPMPEDLRERCIPGLEIDSQHKGQTVHVLAYGISDPHSELMKRLRAQRRNRVERMQEMIARLAALDIEISMEDVHAQVIGASSLGRPHLARALVAKGIVASVQEAFDRYLADEGDGYVALERLTSQEIIVMIRRCGGVSVIAHPMRLREPAHLAELCEIGADGIEVIHPTADSVGEKMLRDFASSRGLLVTGGTDFHAPVPGRELGVELASADTEALLRAVEQRNFSKAS